MENINFIIGGCVKNCEKYIEPVFQNIKLICNNFNIKKIIISYDHSNDKTLFKLCTLKKELDCIDIIINNEPLTNIRTLNISNARNRILDYISNKLQNKIDYLIMMDFDDVCSNKMNINILKNALLFREQWDCITFNNENYYDYWALSFDNYIYSCWHNSNPYLIIKNMQSKLKELLNKTEKYIECYSAFNGFAIYKFEMFKDIRYNTFMNIDLFKKFYNKHIEYIEKNTNTNYHFKNNIDCEHRLFHLIAKFKNNAKIIIYKENLFDKYNGEHCYLLEKIKYIK